LKRLIGDFDDIAAGAFARADTTLGEDKVASRGEFSLVKVWSRSDRPLLVEAVLVEATDPIKYLFYLSALGVVRFSAFYKSLARAA